MRRFGRGRHNGLREHRQVGRVRQHVAAQPPKQVLQLLFRGRRRRCSRWWRTGSLHVHSSHSSSCAAPVRRTALSTVFIHAAPSAVFVQGEPGYAARGRARSLIWSPNSHQTTRRDGPSAAVVSSTSVQGSCRLQLLCLLSEGALTPWGGRAQRVSGGPSHCSVCRPNTPGTAPRAGHQAEAHRVDRACCPLATGEALGKHTRESGLQRRKVEAPSPQQTTQPQRTRANQPSTAALRTPGSSRARNWSQSQSWAQCRSDTESLGSSSPLLRKAVPQAATAGAGCAHCAVLQPSRRE